jgi:hypothetical protein
MSGLAVPGRGNPGPWIGRSRAEACRARGCNLHRSKRKVNPPLLAGALGQGRGVLYIVFPAPVSNALYVLTL